MKRRISPLLMLAAVVSIALVACGGDDDGGAPTPRRASLSPPPPAAAVAAAPTTAPATTGGASAGGATQVSVLNRDMGGSGEYRFDPNEFAFSVGETVEFTIIAETEFHTFTVDELGIDVLLDAGETKTLIYTFDKPGTFKLFCVPHEPLGMVGTITVR